MFQICITLYPVIFIFMHNCYKTILFQFSGHKNIKLFITQGGLQSLQESVLNGIPLIGIPFFGDQFTNVNKMVKKGYGLKIDRSTITKNALVTAIKEVIQKPK